MKERRTHERKQMILADITKLLTDALRLVTSVLNAVLAAL